MPAAISSREFNQDASRAKKIALSADAPVFITEHGKNSCVLMSFSYYQQLCAKSQSLADIMFGNQVSDKLDDINFDFERTTDTPDALGFGKVDFS